MKNEFYLKSFTSKWIKYSDYEFRKDEKGNTYITPAENSNYTIYDPFEKSSDILFDLIDLGDAILKNDDIEKKICTLRVAKRFQKQGIGQHLMELSFEWLNDDKPLITIHNSKKHEFNKLFKRYNFELEEKKWGYYRLFRTELVYNGSLPEKNFFFNRMEMIDLEKEIRQFLLSGRDDFKLFIDEWLYRQWLYSQKEINIITGY